MLYPFPEYKTHYLQSAHINDLLKNKSNLQLKPLTINKIEHNKNNLSIIKLFNNLEHKNLYKIDPQNIFCDLNNCFFEKDDKPLYYDQIHLTEFGAKKINQKIISLIEEIEKK